MNQLGPEGQVQRISTERQIDLDALAQQMTDEVQALPGVTYVFRVPKGLSRWFGDPVVRLTERQHRVDAEVAVGIDKRHPTASTTAQIGVLLRTALQETGLRAGDVAVRVELIE